MRLFEYGRFVDPAGDTWAATATAGAPRTTSAYRGLDREQDAGLGRGRGRHLIGAKWEGPLRPAACTTKQHLGADLAGVTPPRVDIVIRLSGRAT